MTPISKLVRRVPVLIALAALLLSMGGTWTSSAAAAPTLAAKPSPDHDADTPRGKPAKKVMPNGKINLNTANEEQLMLLPTVGPAKAERIVTWRKKNGGFKRVADLRRVKGFGYRTFKRLEPLLDVKGDTTLALK